MKTLLLLSPSWRNGDEAEKSFALEVLAKQQRDVVAAYNRIRMYEAGFMTADTPIYPPISDELPLKFQDNFIFIEPYIAYEEPDSGVSRIIKNPAYENARYSLKFYSEKGYDQFPLTVIDTFMVRDERTVLFRSLNFEEAALAPVQYAIVDHQS